MKSARSKLLLASLLATRLAGCGDGDDGNSGTPPSAESLMPGSYSASDNTIASSFELLVGDSGDIVFANGRDVAGFATVSTTAPAITMSITYLTRVVDDLNGGTPGAQPPSLLRTARVTRSSNDTFVGEGLVLSHRPRSAPAIASLSRNWGLRVLYRFGAEFIDYTAQIDIDSAGVLSGFDTNGCQFRGQISTTSFSLYRVDISATNCGATLRFLPNARYLGYGYLDENTSPSSLRLIAMEPGPRFGFDLRLYPR